MTTETKIIAICIYKKDVLGLGEDNHVYRLIRKGGFFQPKVQYWELLSA